MNKQKKTSYSKRYYIIGYIIFITCWIPGSIFVDSSSILSTIGFLIMCFQILIGGVFLLIGARVEKIEKNNLGIVFTPPKNIFRIFSAPQILLICALVALFGIVFGAYLEINWLYPIFIVALYGFVIASAVVAIVQKVGKKKEFVQLRDGKQVLRTDTTLFCSNCMKSIKQNEAKVIDNLPYCDLCYEQKMKESEKELEKQIHTHCAVCNRDFPKSAFHVVNDKFICEECFQKEFVLNNLFDENK